MTLLRNFLLGCVGIATLAIGAPAQADEYHWHQHHRYHHWHHRHYYHHHDDVVIVH